MPTWTTAADWNSAAIESGVAHEDVANTDHTDETVVRQGYDYTSLSQQPLFGYYPFHENSGTLAHTIEEGNDGAAAGISKGGPGRLGCSSYDFDGVDDRVRVNSTWSYRASFAVWMKTDDPSQCHILELDPSGAYYRFGIYQGELWFNAIGDGNYQTTAYVADGEWHHVGYTYDGTTLDMFCDGSEVGSASRPNFASFSNGDAFIGGDTSDRYFDGKLCEATGRSAATGGWDESDFNDFYNVVAGTGTLTTDWKAGGA